MATDEERVGIDVQSCGYARMMERLGGRDVGHLLICNHYSVMADAAGLELTCTQSCMQDGSRRDF